MELLREAEANDISTYYGPCTTKIRSRNTKAVRPRIGFDAGRSKSGKTHSPKNWPGSIRPARFALGTSLRPDGNSRIWNYRSATKRSSCAKGLAKIRAYLLAGCDGHRRHRWRRLLRVATPGRHDVVGSFNAVG